jgi:MFS family permease
MLQKFIHKLFRKRHYWRTIGFDELSEIYTSMFLRSFALHIIGIFVPIYLYKIGFSLESVFFWIMCWYIFRIFYTFLSAKIIAKIGPKHSIALATVIYIVYLSLLMTIKDLGWPLIILAAIGSLGTALFMIAFEVDFSKVKHSEHGGKELGYEQIFEKVGAVVGPLMGGLIATFIDPRYTIALAIVVLCISLIPLFASAEPTHVRQKIIFKGFPMKRHKRDFISGAVFNNENMITIIIWPIFIAVTILETNTFAVLGVLAAVGTTIALLASFTIGKLVDEQKGGLLLKSGVIVNAITHIFRPFANSITQVLGINLINEPTTIAYRLPYLKGRFDAADSLPGYRIIYFSLIDMFSSILTVVLWLIICLITFVSDPIVAMKWSFIIAAGLSLLILTQRFAALRQ